ncbi:6,7-dimethyl-8-ribityllumazine synthase [Sulfodiicoccus acidiphilus]|uniref:6,7-dimethyl-8-ribityllumazine synthase n=1 Tax=Sulfodiicoccus acidiphilus TaxID=1670455 RepID=A0A348B183_9CREN|nr:6,7-dimethyl-8-ribityllumazine synthase [Sulfodiicoccus acidiphilus]BBD71935.1 6,7-dimethyl-8-ribityllumazine synthase [Sulfodiicoccus acidiphilus]GGT91581.1 6,7-dimethyl-8-ribityllumazine synthase [Sulfodiicoccus acidiphilus]
MQDRSIRLAIVVAEFNYDVTYLMLQRALSHAKFLGVDVPLVVKVPGSFEIPLAASKLAERPDVDAVVTLGAVIKGETKHDESVASQVFRKIMDISLDSNKPVTVGIIGPGASHEQAVDRIEEYAVRAVESAVKMVRRLRSLEEVKEVGETVTVE